MGIMQNKVSRRVALGTIAGGLATGVILLRSWRRPILKEVDPYWKIAIPANKISSELSSSEVRKAFESLEAEREMWLKFKGVAGKVKIISKTVPSGEKKPKVLIDNGYVSLSLNLANAGSGDGGVLPVNVQMVFSQTQNSDPVWKFSMANSTSTVGEKFVGKDIESIHHAHLYSLLTGPLVPMLSLPNSVLGSILGYWGVSREGGSRPGHEAYVFKSNNKLLPVGHLLPSMTFADGHLVKVIPRRAPEKPYPIFSFEDYITRKDVSYPTKITLSFGDHGEFAQKHDFTEITLSDIEVASV